MTKDQLDRLIKAIVESKGALAKVGLDYEVDKETGELVFWKVPCQ